MTYRNRKLLDLAHEMPRQFTFPHNCFGQTIPVHSNRLMFGRGAYHKTPDWAFAGGCMAAHDEIDKLSNMDRELKHAEWLRAYVGTQNWIWTNGRLVVK